MTFGTVVAGVLAPVMHELALFAAIWFMVGAIDELLVDMIWLLCMESRRVATKGAWSLGFDDLKPAKDEHRFAIFIPAWKEAAVIGAMLRSAKRAYAGDNVHLFVGCYPNDVETVQAVVAERGRALTPVIVDRDGPTTKAHCLNNLYAALERHERRSKRPFSGVVLHDAEDVISADEVRVFSNFVDRYAMVQLPVVPLVDMRSRWIGGHYCDEFAESHSRTQVVREAIGAGLPGAGVGCMIRMDALRALKGEGGKPFDEDSVTEDYESGLKLRALGFSSAFVRVGEAADPRFVCTRSHFPETFATAVRQKSRWVIGISLAGWDRLGWGRGLAENWMRLRDRRALVVSAVLLAAYLDLVVGLAVFVSGQVAGVPFPRVDPALLALVEFNGAVLLWRLVLRAYFTGRIYGWREGARAVPRAIVSNLIGIAATLRGLYRYAQMLARRRVEWDKTSHKFAGGSPS